jgi:hypothetical protein
MREPRDWRRHPRLSVGLRLAAAAAILALCVYAARQLDIAAAGAMLCDAKPGWVVLATFVNFPLTLVQALRWRILLGPASQVRVLSLFRYKLTAQAVSNLLPIRPGDALRVYLPWARHGVPAVTATSALVIEHALEGCGLALVAAPLLLLGPTPAWVRAGTALVAAASLGALAVAATLARHPRVEPPHGWRYRLQLSAQAMRRPAAAAALLGLTLLGWTMEVLLVVVCLTAVGIPATLSSAALVLLAVNLTLSVPATPANLGPFEASVFLALAALGVTGPRALAMALLYHLVQLVPSTLAGLEGLRLVGELRRGRTQPWS